MIQIMKSEIITRRAFFKKAALQRFRRQPARLEAGGAGSACLQSAGNPAD